MSSLSTSNHNIKPTEILGSGSYLQLVMRNGYEFATRIKGVGVVAIVPVTDDGKVVLIKQFREPLKSFVIDLPAGLVGDNHSSEDFSVAAQRELLEECGYFSHKLQKLFVRPTSGGMTDETIVYYLAQRLERISDGGGVEDEKIEVHAIPMGQIDAWLNEQAKDSLIDSKVDVGLRYLEKFLFI